MTISRIRGILLVSMLFCLFCGSTLAVQNNARSPVSPDAPVKGLSSAPVVKLKTSLGDIFVRLDERKAPISTANFIQYVKSGHYDDTIFHRVINGFIIQGGGFTPKMRQKPVRDAIRNEADNGLKNHKYTLAMAHINNEPHSATAQFFINTKDNSFLDFRGQTTQGWGYAVFGKVIKGQDVVDKIEAVATGKLDSNDNVPATPVLIKKAVLVTE